MSSFNACNDCGAPLAAHVLVGALLRCPGYTPVVILDVVVPIRTTSKTNDRDHHQARSRKATDERDAVALLLTQSKEVAKTRMLKVGGSQRPVLTLSNSPLPVSVSLTRISANFLDDDNVRGALKSVRDEVAAWIGVDDRDPRVLWHYGQLKKPRHIFGVHIVVEKLPADAVVAGGAT